MRVTVYAWGEGSVQKPPLGQLVTVAIAPCAFDYLMQTSYLKRECCIG